MRLLTSFACGLAVLAFSLSARAEDDAEAKETPEEAFASFKAAVKKKDGDAVWAFFSKKTHKKIAEQMGPMMQMIKGNPEAMAEMAKEMEVTEEELEKMSDEELTKAMVLKGMEKESEGIDDVKWIGAKIDGNTAICETQEKDKDVEQVVLVLEGGRWKLDLEATEKLKKESGDDEEEEGMEEDEEEDEEEGSGK